MNHLTRPDLFDIHNLMHIPGVHGISFFFFGMTKHFRIQKEEAWHGVGLLFHICFC